MPTAHASLPRAYRGRFAPTPSGPLHLGSLLTALAGYLDARAASGQWLLRIDDLDSQRSRTGISDVICLTLQALGLEWDGEITTQASRRWRYQEALEKLSASGHIYACDCTRRETHLQRPDPTGACPGRCRDRNLPFREGQTALRIRAEATPLFFEDRIKGPCSVSLMPYPGDFTLFRRDGVHAYHLATVIDDHDAGITHIVRGEDLLESTPQQIFLQQRLGFVTPLYAHTPLMISTDGKKLSKSEGAPPVGITEAKKTLHLLLRYLDMPPPATLEGAAPSEILAWAREAWNPTTLKNKSTILIEDNRIPA